MLSAFCLGPDGLRIFQYSCSRFILPIWFDNLIWIKKAQLHADQGVKGALVAIEWMEVLLCSRLSSPKIRFLFHIRWIRQRLLVAFGKDVSEVISIVFCRNPYIAEEEAKQKCCSITICHEISLYWRSACHACASSNEAWRRAILHHVDLYRSHMYFSQVCAHLRENQIFTWGSGSYGRLGLGPQPWKPFVDACYIVFRIDDPNYTRVQMSLFMNRHC